MSRQSKPSSTQTQFTDHGIRTGVGLHIEQGIKDGLFNGATVGVVTLKGPEVITYGKIDANGPALVGTARYDLSSITKAFVALLTHILLTKRHAGIEHFTLDSHVADYLGMTGHYTDKLKVKHLLWFLADFALPEMKEMVRLGRDPLKEILAADLEALPGQRYHYCNHSSTLLGLFLEKVSRRNIDRLIDQFILEPLSMSDTTFFPHRKDWPLSQFVSTEGFLRGFVHDESARHLMGTKDKAIASAGMFSTAGDMLKLLGMFLHGGRTPSGKVILPNGVIRKLGVNRTKGKDEAFGNGFGLWRRFSSGFGDHVAVSSPGGFFRSGYSGCVMVCLPHDKVGFFIGTDFLAFGRSKTKKGQLFKWMTVTISNIVRELREEHYGES